MAARTKTPDDIKRAQLRKHKALATGLFVLMALIYITCEYLLVHIKTGDWVHYVRAFSEAAMVGALADWFAVTALFHHPLGIPIPHTNLIENSKKRIGDNLGGFVTSNFLNAATIRPYIERLQISNYVANWLRKEKNVQLLVNEIAWLLTDIVQKINDRAAVRYISHKASDVLDTIKLNELLSSGLQIIMERGDHVRLLDFVISKARDYIIDHEDLVRKRVKEESYFLIPSFVDNAIASKIVKGAANYLGEIQEDAGHKIREDLNSQLRKVIEDIKSKPQWQAELQSLKDGLLAGDKLQQYAASIWDLIKNNILNDLTTADSALKNYLAKSILEMARNLQTDETMRHKIDSWIRQNAYKYTLRNADKVQKLISDTVGDWEGRDLSRKLELEVGKDFQFIRINGTIVGGLVGLLIYTITRWLG
ncbi:MAG: DUF445 domain-containing protein [Niabella sp.]